MEVINTIGRRKTSVARIYMKPGKGEITVNNRSIETYFPFDLHQIVVKQPLALVGVDGSYDIKINVDGGGITGQAEAARMAISRALCEINAEHRPALKKEGFLHVIQEWWNVRSQDVEKQEENSSSQNVNWRFFSNYIKTILFINGTI
jgi:small subunit ribosomal protein S9